MKAGHCAWALPLLALAAPADAKGYAWCRVNGGKYQAYLSGIVEIDDGPDAFRALTGSFASGFRDYVQSALDPNASKPDCNSQESRFYAEDYIEVLIKANPGFKFVKTGWRGPRPATAANDPAKRGGGESRTQAGQFRK